MRRVKRIVSMHCSCERGGEAGKKKGDGIMKYFCEKPAGE